MSTGPSVPSEVSRSYLLMGPVTAHVNINVVWRQDYLPACMDAN